MTISRRKFVAFAAVAFCGSTLVILMLTLVADLYAHSRVERSVGVNRHGYRGAVAGKKVAGRRIVMLGGSTVFGWDVAVDDTIPAILERLLREADWRTSVVNLGFIGEGAHAFLPTLDDYGDLDYDVAVLYEGYNDLAGDAQPNTDLLRHQSAVFRLTGYFPILPLFLKEKAFALRAGTVGAAYDAARQGKQTTFRPGLANRTSAAALETASSIASTLGRQLDHFAAAPVTAARDGKAGCAPPWSFYCDAVAAAVDHVLGDGKPVIVVLQPRLKNDRTERHADQQRALREMMARRYGDEARARVVDVSHVVDLANQEIAFDGMHLNATGNTMIARALVAPVASAAGITLPGPR